MKAVNAAHVITIRTGTARNSQSVYSISIPESVVAPYRAQWAKRMPTVIDPMTASAHDVALHACQMPYVLRTSIAAAGRGRRKAIRWATAWLIAGCPGVPLPHPRAGWRAARMKCGGVALYDGDADRCFLWLAPPPWFQGSKPFEEIWYSTAVHALGRAGI